MEIRRLFDKFFDTNDFTDEQLLLLWEKSMFKNSQLNQTPLIERMICA